MADEFGKYILEMIAGHDGEWSKSRLLREAKDLNPNQARLVAPAIEALETAGLIESRTDQHANELRYWITPAGRDELPG